MRLELGERVFDLTTRALVMGILNRTPDSFSERGAYFPMDRFLARADQMVAEGADLLDVGGVKAGPGPEVGPEEELERVLPGVEALVARFDVPVSVDTWRAPVARAALAAGAALVNDPSGLSDPDLASACADAGAGLVLTHTRVPPKVKAFPSYDDVVARVRDELEGRVEQAIELGVGEDGLLLDPGIDLAKTPAESIELLRRLGELRTLGRPLIVAVSRKDFVGALTGRPPAARDAGTLAAVGVAARAGARVLRVHDVAAARDYLRVRAALEGDAAVPAGPLHPDLRRERVA